MADVEKFPHEIGNKRTDVRGEFVNSSSASKTPPSSGTLTEDISRVQSASKPYDSGKLYSVGDIRTIDEITYVNITAITIAEPFTPSKWKKINQNEPVINKTGSTLNKGDIVFIDGYDVTSDRVTVALSLADVIPNANVFGVCNEDIANNAEGIIAQAGIIFDIDTSSFTPGDTLFLSETTPGTLTNVRPNLAVRIAHVGKSDASTGWIILHILELGFPVQASLVSDVTQNFTAGVSTPIEFDVNEILIGILHDTVTNPENIIFQNDGKYAMNISPQLIRTGGGGGDVINIYVQKQPDGGSFSNIPNTNFKLGVSSSNVESVQSKTILLDITALDTIRIMARSSSSSMELEASAGDGTPPNDIPATSSARLGILRVAG